MTVSELVEDMYVTHAVEEDTHCVSFCKSNGCTGNEGCMGHSMMRNGITLPANGSPMCSDREINSWISRLPCLIILSSPAAWIFDYQQIFGQGIG
eukprot:scaffold11702_cov56-Cylindrotheca_fusiformis.AAC.4